MIIWDDFSPRRLIDQLLAPKKGKENNFKNSCFSRCAFSAEEATDLYINNFLYITAPIRFLSVPLWSPSTSLALKSSCQLSHLGLPAARKAPCAFLPLCPAIFAWLLCLVCLSLPFLVNYCSSLKAQFSFCLLKTSLTC